MKFFLTYTSCLILIAFILHSSKIIIMCWDNLGNFKACVHICMYACLSFIITLAILKLFNWNSLGMTDISCNCVIPNFLKLTHQSVVICIVWRFLWIIYSSQKLKKTFCLHANYDIIISILNIPISILAWRNKRMCGVGERSIKEIFWKCKRIYNRTENKQNWDFYRHTNHSFIQ